jgi:hypothetical protein
MKKIILLLAVALSTLTTFAVPVIIYVSPTGSSATTVNGLSWENAVSLERGRNLSNFYFSQATPVDNQVWVKAGTYNLSADAFNLNFHMALYGGFAGNETDFSERNWVTNQTILNQTASKMVIFGNGQISSGVFTDYNVLLDGFILQGGRITGAGGCGQIVQGTTLRNCIIRNNKATTHTGALIFKAVTVTGTGLASTKKVILDNCLIVNNEAATSPSTITAAAVPADIINCTMANNYITAINTTAALTGTAYKVFNSIVYNNYNGTTLAKSFGDGDLKELVNNAWDNAATNGIRTNNISLTSSPFVAATSYVGSANGTDKLLSTIESADFKLASGSTCINAGNNTYATATSDLAGNNRIQNTTVEIGCYEVTPTAASIEGGNLNNTGLTNIQLANTDITVSSGEFVADATKAVKSLTIAPGAKLTLSSGTLSATNGITLESDATGTATLKGSGGLSGTVTAKQYLGSARNWYVSSPVSSASAPATNMDYYYEYMEGGNNTNGNNEWASQPGSPTLYWKGLANGTTMEVGKGYIAKTNAGATVQFSGTPNNGDIETNFNLTRDDNKGKGFNLVGNPYPSYIDWTDVAAANPNLDNTYYYRTKNTNVTNTYTFVTWNGAGAGSYVVSNGSLPANTSITSFIPPTQAFWVRVKSGTETTKMYFNNGMREHRLDNNNLMKAHKQDARTSLRLQLQNGTDSDEMLVYLDSEASNNYDAYDSPKMMNNSVSVPDLYSKVGNERLVINGLNSISDNMELPLGFSLNAAASLKLKTIEMSNLPIGTRIYLLDKEENIQTELLSETEYGFKTSAATTNNESRFSLLFRAPGNTTGIDNTSKFNAQVFVNANNQISIITPEKATYSIYNAVGQLIENGIVNSKHSLSRYIGETRNSKLNSGVYVVKVNNKSTRVIIK